MISKINTIIIEDNIQSQEYLTDLLSKNFSNLSVIGYADSIYSATNLINQKRPELIFMDIELKDGYCFDIFKNLHFHDFEIIFVTAFDNLIQTAIDHYAFSFLTKPINNEKLIKAINRYLDLSERLYSKAKYNLFEKFLMAKDSQVLIQIGHNYISLKLNDIIKCIAEGNFTSFYLTNKEKHLASKPLKHYENLFTEKGFFKANRSTIININHIDSIYKKESIILKNKDKIRVSIRNKPNLTQLINFFS